ncbi:MAG: hypothetical protein GY822_04930 [Deltaproteobacteria bacterium]|nr:hypothetical protein [Deltaproteobacteria bacterium]
MSTTASPMLSPSQIADLLHHEQIQGDELKSEIAHIMCTKVGHTSSGFPYLAEPSWVRFRDWVPYTFADGGRALNAAEVILQVAKTQKSDPALLENLEAAAKVIHQVVNTAQVTAPPDCWLLFHIMRGLQATGIATRLWRGDIVEPESAYSEDGSRLMPHELLTDLTFLLSRGLLLKTRKGFRAADHDAARDVLSMFADTELSVLSALPSGLAESWQLALNTSDDSAEKKSGDERAQVLLKAFSTALPSPPRREAGRWQPTSFDAHLGARLVPLVLGLRAANRIPAILDDDMLKVEHFSGSSSALSLFEIALSTFRAAGGVLENGSLTATGRRILERGPGPFGIIETYHPYLAQLPEILSKGRSAVWVERTANVAASQDANRKTFLRANDILDRFCDDTGFSYDVFIEHALGKGEATRQRYQRNENIRFVGADLEDAAIDAAIAERDAGHLPQEMAFVREADIGKPALLLKGLQDAKVNPDGAVMMVGNGFHEVRGQTDEFMTQVFAGYERAGIVLLFTEETSLSIDDLLQTAWNTYHAGFKYVHQRSGQGLRPAVPRPPSVLEGVLPISWTECAERAGYKRIERYSSKSRTVYPYTPTSGHNPSISVTHFCLPEKVADQLAIK